VEARSIRNVSVSEVLGLEPLEHICDLHVVGRVHYVSQSVSRVVSTGDLACSLPHGLNRPPELLGDPEVAGEVADWHEKHQLLEGPDVVPLLSSEVVARRPSLHVLGQEHVRVLVEAHE